MNTVSIPLTQMLPSYTGKHKTMEVQPAPCTQKELDSGGTPCIYLQRVDGCGYDVNELTAEEAFKIGTALVEASEYIKKPAK